MDDEAQAGPTPFPGTLAVVPVGPAELPSTSNTNNRRVARFFGLWRRPKPEEPSGLEQLSVSTLQAELQVIDEGIAASLQNIAALEAGEREALNRRDKLALDVAWRGRETETAKIRQLDDRRQLVYAALKRRLEPEVDAWRERCELAVSRWRTQDRDQLERIEGSLREVEALVWSLANREMHRSNERKRLMAELEVLREQAKAIPVDPPEIDWATQPISLTDVTIRLEAVLELLQRPELEARLRVG